MGLRAGGYAALPRVQGSIPEYLNLPKEALGFTRKEDGRRSSQNEWSVGRRPQRG